MRANEFDALAYIENAFLDKEKREVLPESDELSVAIPSISDYLNKKETGNGTMANEAPLLPLPLESDIVHTSAHHTLSEEIVDKGGKRTRFKKTLMSAPRPRRARSLISEKSIDPDLQATWQTLPKSIAFLTSFYDDSVTANYYGKFDLTRNDLIKKLLDPELSLEDTSRLLGVCPATVRRYTNRGWLTHHRTGGGQRRFRLSDIVRFVEIHGRFPEE